MEKGSSSKKWLVGVLAAFLVSIGIPAAMIAYIDPYYHYHKPLKEYSYTAEDEPYYMNDGIMKYFDYDSIITGTSMSENFKASEAEKLFGGSFIKVPFYGGSNKEINDRLYRAFEGGRSPRIIIRSLDCYSWEKDKDFSYHDYSDMKYFYNDFVLDDANYLFNYRILRDCVLPSLFRSDKSSPKQIDFDAYCSWELPHGKEIVLSSYEHKEEALPNEPITEAEKEKVLETNRQNTVAMAAEHPETTFYYFYPPYSICLWDEFHSQGKLLWTLGAEKAITEELLAYPNVRVFSFWNNQELFCNLDNYKDIEHYISEINSSMLEWMKEGKYQLTKENYQQYYQDAEEFLLNYDYSQFSRAAE